MSQQSGITVTQQLKQVFAGCNDGHVRMIKMSIANEQIVLDVLNNPVSTWDNDWNKLIGESLHPDRPCYLLYRLDTRSQGTAYDWIFLSFCPDIAPVKHKMLHASTKATLKREFGEGAIKADIFGTIPSELTLEAYKAKLVQHAAPKPLTAYEEDLVAIREQEFRPDVGATTKRAVMKGVDFPITEEAETNLRIFASGRYNYVVLTVDVNLEHVGVELSGNIASADDLGKKLPQGHARFILFRYLHLVAGQRREPVLFIYYVPASGSPVKERMLYSSCKARLMAHLQTILGNDPNNLIAKSLEIDSPDELSVKSLNIELDVEVPVVQPAQPTHRLPAPPGRGPRRMIRTPNQYN